MTKLCFAIPTWNRANKLLLSVETIAQQIEESGADASIFISDNHSDDETPQVIDQLCSKYAFIQSSRRVEHGGVFDNLADVTAKAVGDYIWWFGDDDVLLPGGLMNVLCHLTDASLAFVSAGNGTFKPHSGRVLSGTLLEICNQIGWNQTIGWISADILRNDVAQKVWPLMQVEPYKLDAYAHVGATLSVAAHLNALHIDQAIAQPQGEQNKEDSERWEKENIGWRYFLLIDTFKYLFEKKILTQKLQPRFFKYLNYYLWDRFLVNLMTSSIKTGNVPNRGLEILMLMADMVDDADIRKSIRIRTESANSLFTDRRHLIEQLIQNEQRLVNLANETNQPVLPLGTLSR
jgi:glycosyltransferase involved in cell wall biosynthesis